MIAQQTPALSSRAGSATKQTVETPDWLARVRDGDPVACRRFVCEHAPRMYSIARRFLRCEHDSADAVQEAFGSAFRSFGSFGGNSAVSTWLYRIVVNACLMKLRAKSRQKTASIDDLLPAFDASGRHARPVTRWQATLPDAAADADLRAKVRDCMERLPDEYRQVLILRDVEEFDTEQTAEILGLTTANVKVRLHRARAALRSMLSPACDGCVLQ